MNKIEMTILKMENDLAHYEAIPYFPATPISMAVITRSMLKAYKQGLDDANCTTNESEAKE